MSQGTKAVKAALLANLVVAIIKFIAAFFTNSKAMLAEAIHSLADSLNQILLLVGIKQSIKRPDDNHNFDYGECEFSKAVMTHKAGAGDAQRFIGLKDPKIK